MDWRQRWSLFKFHVFVALIGQSLIAAGIVSDCDPLVPPDNGAVDTSSGTTLGKEAHYRCNSGHELSGTSVVVCLSTGKWSDGPPSCLKTDCGPLVPPDNGAVDTPSGTTLGKEAHYRCNSGHDLSGSSVVVCLSTGKWSDVPPRCLIKECATLPPTIDSGSVDTVLTSTGILTAVYSCNVGYYSTGNQTLLCTATGEWDGTPPTCTIYDCGPLTPPENGKVDTSPGTQYMDTAAYTCMDGYQLEGSNTRVCQSNGSWEGQAPECLIRDCGRDIEISYGTVDFSSGTAYQSPAIYSCLPGYHLVGIATRTCSADGIWSGEPPACLPSDCPQLESPQDGSVKITVGASEIATYSCNEGFTISGSDTRSCSSGTWMGQAPLCLPDGCPSLVIPFGDVTMEGTGYGATATITCHHGYMIVGPSSAVCLGDRWSNVPSCHIAECPALEPPQDGSVSITLGANAIEVATYSCNKGFMIRGLETRTCNSGTWTGLAPLCLANGCARLVVTFGDVIVEGVGYGATATITCHHGYRIVGPSSVICLGDRWSNVPSCYIADCGSLPRPVHGSVYTAAGTTFGQTATFSCDSGYALIGDETRYCTSLGSWDGTQPFCKAVGCITLSNPVFGLVDVSGTTVEDVATYSCLEGYLLQGNSERVCGSNGEWSGVPPTCKIIDCRTLSHPMNGTVDTSLGTTYKKTAVYSCMTGFTLNGSYRRTCGETGQWSDDAPTCDIKDCGPLPHPANGEVMTTLGTTYHQLAKYRCDTGHTIKGASVRACLDTGLWSGAQPTCIHNDCSPLTNPKNGEVKTNGTAFGQSAEFTCHVGYRMIGEPTIVCRSDAQWSDRPPNCHLIDCGLPDDPSNGNVTAAHGTLFAAMLQYSCDVGYTMKGPAVRICSQDGSWSGEETVCEITDCGTPPAPHNGSVVMDKSTFGGKARFRCEKGYNMSGSRELECLANGDWNGKFPTCTIVDCGLPDLPANIFYDSNSTTYETTLKLSCLPGYILKGHATLSCTEKGTWNRKPPRCESVDCGGLRKPVHGLVNVSGETTLGNIATYYCEPGFDLIGHQNRACGTDGTWSGTPPICQPKDCGTPPPPRLGLVDISSGTIYGKVARYSCEKGYYVDGLSERPCGEDGRWNGSNPVCRIHDCGKPSSPSNGSVRVTSRTIVGRSVQFSCDVGYDLIGSEIVTCEEHGNWSDSPPLCILTDCGGLSSPGNGSVSTEEQTTTYGQVANYTCNPGYTLIGEQSRTCQQDGNWSGSPPVCEVKDCGPLEAPLLGSVVLPWGSTYNQRALYTCDMEGFYLSGPKIRVCDHNGTWSGDDPVCKIYDCGTPKIPANGSANVPNVTTHGAVATFSCNFGYTLTGSETRICFDGSWTGFETSCPLQDCGSLEEPLLGFVNVKETTFNSTATYTCSAGYEILGSSNRTCLGNGSWSQVAPTCVPVDCGEPYQQPRGSASAPNGTTYNETAYYQCDVGYYLHNNISSSVCGKNGKWRPSRTYCVIHDCGPLSAPVNGNITLPRYTVYGQRATYSCLKGFKVVGEKRVTCTANGNWSSISTCTIVDCGYLKSIRNGMVDIMDGTTFLKVATYSCYPGYDLKGPSSRVCWSMEKWSAREPRCVAKDCGGLSHPANGVANIPYGTTYGENVIYTCYPGYQLVGNDTRVCTDTGVWSRAAPRCSIKVCGVLEAPVHGSVEMSGITYGAVATYACDHSSFRINGPLNRQCLSDGRWNGKDPTCDLKAGLKVVPLALSLNVSMDEAKLSSRSVYTEYENTVKNMLTVFYKKEMGTNIKEVLIQDLQEGSLKVEYEVIMSDSDQSVQQFGVATQSLPHMPLGVISDQTAVSVTMTVDGGIVELENVSSDFLKCLAYTAAKPCDLGFICVLRNSTAVCEPDPATDCGPLDDPINGAVDISQGTSYGNMVSYSCNQGHRLLGNSRRSCQADSSWTGSDPTCPVIDCGSVTRPEHGSVSLTNTTVGSSVSYKCSNGYGMVGQSQATCLLSGKWSSPEPTCIATGCEAIESPVSGVLSIENTSLGMIATYRCLEGYTLFGVIRRACKTGTRAWTGRPSVCIIKDCGRLDHPYGGRVALSAGTTYGSVATYSCTRTGYKLSGVGTRLCGVSGEWSNKQPRCVPHECKSLSMNPRYGRVAYSIDRRVGSNAQFSCSDGFRLSGPEMIACGVNGKWSEKPSTCISTVNCPSLSSPVNGKVAVSGFYLGDNATYTCTEGYKVVGNQTRECLITEEWSGEEPTCQLQDCGAPTVPVDGSVNVTGTTYGNLATYYCSPGHGLVGPTQALCLSTGTWSASAPKCVLNCPSLPTPENGMVELSGLLLVTLTATFSCNHGYDLVGGHQRICEGGKWSGIPSFCIAKDCGAPPNVTHGKVGLYNSTTYGQEVMYACFDGHVLLGSNKVVCQENSTWSPPPTCTLVDCGPPELPQNGSVVVNTGTLYGHTANYSCKPEYEIVGSYIVTCLDTGHWSHNSTCQVKDCGPLSSPTYGHVNLLPDTLYGSRAFYSCLRGYRLTGSRIRLCTAEGWSGMAAVCALRDCKQPKAIADGNVTTPGGTTYNQTAIYSCNYGYALHGVKTRTCLAVGRWSDTEPNCTYFDCGPLKNPENGNVSTPGGIGYGQVGEYACNVGYFLLGHKKRQCLDTGSWSGSPPTCRIHDCGPLKKPAHGKVSYNITTYRAEATYECDSSYSLVGDPVRICGKNGNWSGSDTMCDKQKKMALVLGLTVGLSVVFLIIVGVIIAVILNYVKRSKKRRLRLKRNLQFYNSPALGHISPTRFASPCHLIEDESPTTILGDRYYYPREDGSPPRRLTNGYHYPREEERLANGYHYPREDGSPRTRLANGYHYSREDGSPPRLANGYHYPREDRIPPRRLAKDYPREESPPTRRHSRYARDEGSPTTRWQEEGSPPTRLYSGHYLPRVPSPTRAGSGRRARSVSSLSNQDPLQAN